MFPKIQQASSVANSMNKAPPFQYVIPGSKVSTNHNIYVPNQSYELHSHMGMKIKDEPESPTTRNLPATPKSNDPPTSQSEGVAYTAEQREEAEKNQENKQFILAPTPAQLGKAPLQRRLNRSNYLSV